MPEAKFGTALDTIRQRRRFLFELIIIAIVIAICINIFSSALLELFLQKSENFGFWWTCLIVSGVGLLTAIVFAYSFAFRKTVRETTFIGVTLAIHVDSQKGVVDFLPCDGYEPAKQANTLYGRISNELNPIFISGWPGPEAITSKAFGPANPCREAITELLEAILMILIREFGRRSLTHTAMYHTEFRKFADKIQEKKLGKESWPSRLSANRFLVARGVRQVQIPEWVQLETPDPEPKQDGKPPERLIRLTTEYGKLTFSITPYWTRLRELKTAVERFAPNLPDQVSFLRVPLDIHQEFRARYISRKKLYSDGSEMSLHYFWFQSLVKNAFRRMDWGRHLRGEGEPGDAE